MNQQPFHALVTGLLLAGTLSAADWPQYRGPLWDGSTPEQVRTNWTETPLRVLWRRTQGPGWSSPVVSGGRVFTQVRIGQGVGGDEVCIALDPETGRQLWARTLEPAAYSNLAGYDDRIDGPRSTPSVSGDRVFILTSQLKLFCLRASDGAVVWSRDFVSEFGSSVIEWQNAASPLVIGDLVLVNCNANAGRLLAVRASDGTTVWQAHDGQMTHASPAYGILGGKPNVVFLTGQGLIGITPETGAEQWRLRFTPSFTSTAATPVLVNDHVYASAAYGFGAITARIRTGASGLSATQAWRQRSTAFQNHWSTPVAHDGFLYSVVESGTDGGVRTRSLACLDVQTGVNRWITGTVGSGRIGFGNVIKAGGLLLALTESGELVLIQPDPEAYREIARQRILTTYCWNIPVVAGGRLFARSSSQMIALDVAAPVAPLPPLELTARPGADSPGIVVVVSGRDGVPLDASVSDRIQLLGAPNLTVPMSLWNLQAPVWTVVEGRLEAVLPADSATRFLRIQETAASP